MFIKNLEIVKPIVLAPMAGITDRAFRHIIKEFECGLVYTEMISAKALTYKNVRTKALVDIAGEQAPVTVQLFGSEPEVMAEGAIIVQGIGADIVDINMGCPVPKLIKNCEGSALMRDITLAEQIIKAMVKRVNIPITVKIRKGWDDNSINAVEFARMAEASGVSAVAVHGRTRSQLYSGEADWNIIRQVKNAIKVPVIGNGDIWQPEDARRMISITGCDAVMVGRGVLGNPWLVKRSVKYLEEGVLLPPPSPKDKVEMAIKHLNMVISNKGETIGVKEMRKHIAWYVKGLKDAARIREKVNKLKTKDEVIELLVNYLNIIEPKSTL